MYGPGLTFATAGFLTGSTTAITGAIELTGNAPVQSSWGAIGVGITFIAGAVWFAARMYYTQEVTMSNINKRIEMLELTQLTCPACRETTLKALAHRAEQATEKDY